MRCGWSPGWTSRTSRTSSAAHAEADLADHGDERRAPPGILSAPSRGAYGAGILPLLESRNWRDDADLAEVYATWGGFAYGRGLDGRAARADMENAYRGSRWRRRNVDTASTTSRLRRLTFQYTAA